MEIGVIGAGIGGSGFSYFVKEKIPNANITVFEKDKIIGGRIKGTVIDNNYLELGGSFYHPVNKIIHELIRNFELETFNYNPPTLGVWNGDKFLFKTHKSQIISAIRMLKEFKLDILKFRNFLLSAKKKILRIYDLLERPYFSLEDLLNDAGLSKWLVKSTEDLLLETGFSEKFISELVYPLIHYIYNQDVDVNGFAGIATLLASDGSPIRSVKGGNALLLQRLLSESKAKVLTNTPVIKIIKEEGRYVVEWQRKGENASVFDAVAIATPIESSNIIMKEIEKKIPERPFQKGTVTLVKGIAKPEFWGEKSLKNLPALIITTKNAIKNLISMELLVDTPRKDKIYNLFSTDPLSDSMLQELFDKVSFITYKEWNQAYPKLVPTSTIPPLVLDKNLFYLNSVETFASSMESSLLAAKNTSLLVS